MADGALVELLLTGADRWNQRRPRGPHGAPRKVDLSGADLRSAALTGADLKHAVLSDADIHAAEMVEANLCYADLRRADLAGANLRGANMLGADLRGADLSGVDLRGADLSGAKVNGADLSEANLGAVDLRQADLRGVNLSRAKMSRIDARRADVREADLHEADLREANLSGADLRGSNLSAADLSWAELHEAELDGVVLLGGTMCATRLTNIDLANVTGLASIRHAGPSSIGVDTLYRSRGHIPEEFLRGCGVPTVMVGYVPSLVTNSVLDFYSCFISYSHANAEFARQLYDHLFNGSKISCWLDEHQILPGDKLDERIDDAIRTCDKVLLVCSKEVLDGPTGGWWVDREVTRALQREERLSRERNESVKMLIPLDLDGFLFTPECKYHRAADLRERLAQSFVGWETDDAVYTRGLERVVRALRTDGFKVPLIPRGKL